MSARRRIALCSLGGVALVIAIVFGILSYRSQKVILKSGGVQYTLQVSSTPQARERGLGKRRSLPSNEGMLFVFSTSGTQCFWMKDMYFPLDMIWLGANKRIEYLLHDISPATYPHVFCPAVSAKYVIELNAGQTMRAHMHTGEVLAF